MLMNGDLFVRISVSAKRTATAFDRLAGHIRGFLWQRYADAGMPYGESVEGFDRWCEDQSR